MEDPEAYYLNKSCIISRRVDGMQTIYKVYKRVNNGLEVLIEDPTLCVLNHDTVRIIKSLPNVDVSIVYKVPSMLKVLTLYGRDVLYFENNICISTGISSLSGYNFGITISKMPEETVLYNDYSLPVRDTLICRFKEYVLFRNKDTYKLLNSETHAINDLLGGNVLLGINSIMLTTRVLNFGAYPDTVTASFPFLIVDFENALIYKLKRNQVRIISKGTTAEKSWSNKPNLFYTTLRSDKKVEGVLLKYLIAFDTDVTCVSTKTGKVTIKQYKKGTPLFNDIYTKYIGKE